MQNASTQMLKRVFLGAFALLLMALSLLCSAPERAFAYFYQASSQYPATQDLQATASSGLSSQGKEIYGDMVYASDIAPGTYTIPAYSSSRMCNFYATLADATAKTNPNQAVITASGDTITATFYMSGAYTALYLGTAEAAAAIAPADGITPAGAYLTDGSDSYDVGHGPFHVTFTALNGVFTFSAYSGGSNGTAAGLWYTRQGSFIATTDFVEAYCAGGGVIVPDDPEPTPGPVPPGPDAGGVTTPEYEESAPTIEETPEPDQSLVQVASDPNQIRGVLVRFTPEDFSGEGANGFASSEGLLELGGLTMLQLELIAGAGLLVAGMLWSVIRYRFGLRKLRQ